MVFVMVFSVKSCLLTAKIRINIAIFESFMENLYKYAVAGHTFAVSLPDGYSEQVHLSPYIPFRNVDDCEPLFTLRLQEADNLRGLNPGKAVECLNDEAPYFWLFKSEGDGYPYNFGFSYTKSHPDCIVMCSSDMSDNVVYVPSAYAGRLAEFALSNAMMLLYTFRTNPYDTLMVHASVISHGGGAYMFLGRSGTGKSTHSRLWLENIEDSVLLNDDNPVIRMIDGEAIVYGTPWSGKTPCYKNEAQPLKAVVRLSQAPFNKIAQLPPLKAYASLMPACSCMRWDSYSTESLHKTVEKVIMKVRGWHLECLPDADAAHVCHEAVTL